MITTVRLGQRAIGRGYPCFIIAEAGVNHNGNLGKAMQMIDAAVQAGADAVKFQTFQTDAIVTRSAPKADYQLKHSPRLESHYDMLKRLELSAQAHHDLAQYCKRKGILFLSSALDEASSDLLEKIGVEAFKVPSSEITNLPFLEHLARKGRLMILSTGMSDLKEIRTAVETILNTRHCELILLHCVSNHPVEPAESNLLAMKTMASELNLPIGFSDHALGIEISLAAVALGACVIEKHFTLSRNLPGPDQKASLEPKELQALVRGIRTVERSLGNGRKEPAKSESHMADVMRKSLVAAINLPAGTKIAREHLVCKRPGTGLPPSRREEVIGRTVTRNVRAGSILKWNMFR